MERKTSLAARLQRLGTPSQPDNSQGADVQNTQAGSAADADASTLLPALDLAPQPPKRRLPAWLTAPPPAAEPTEADAPAAAQQSKPKVSIRARVAASQATAGLQATQTAETAAAPASESAVAAAAGAAAPAAGAGGSWLASLHSHGTAGGEPSAGPKTSLARLLQRPRVYRSTMMPPPAAAPSAAAAAAAGAHAAGAQKVGALQAGQEQEHANGSEQQQEQQHVPGARRLPGSIAAAAEVGGGSGSGSGGTPNKSPQPAHSADSLWDSDTESQQDAQIANKSSHRQQQVQQQQQQQQQDERELTLQQRQARQMAQLGLKLPGASGAADDDAWLQNVFAKAAGGSGGRGRQGQSGGRGRSGGAAAAAAGGSGGNSRVGGSGHCARAGGSGGRARSGGGGSGGRVAGGAVPPVSGRVGAAAVQDYPETAAATAAAAAAAAAAATEAVGGSEGGVQHEPLVLYDEESNLRLQVPGSINQHLRSYQRQGVQFLFSRYAAGSGAVLCDDMGLGKTVQAISFIAALLGKQGTSQDALPRSFAAYRRQRQQQRLERRQLFAHINSGIDRGHSDSEGDSQADSGFDAVEDASSTIRWPVLVVCPTSVLDNWMRELNMWGTFKAIKYHGPPAARAAIADEASGGQYEVILTSYDTLRVDAAALNDLHPHAVIFDEAHKLKNAKSKQYEAAQSLTTRYRYGLSGTIMQNDWDELYAVLDLLCPYCLGEYGGFVEYYSKPIKRGQSSTASNYEKVKSEKRLKQLVEVVKGVTLRRTKAIIADQLPRKTDNVVFCQLQALQYRAYDRTLASPDLQALRLAKSPCECGSGQKSADCCHEMVPASERGVLWPHYHCCDCRVEGCKRHRPYGCKEYYESMGYTNARLSCPYCLMLPAISLLTKISNHLELIRPDAKLQQQDERQFEFELAVARMVLGPDAEVLGGLLANSSGWLGASDETHCGKMATLKMLLHTWANDYSSHNKVLLFSHSTRCLDLLEAFVQRQGWDYVRLDGSTPQKQRQGICDEFNNRPSIFLLLMSTVAGGLGLNLTAANKVVVFDPSWNPAHDLQAQDRAYRLGQTRDVAVYRLVGTGTLEEAVYKRQIYKQQQSNMVIDGAQEPRYWEGVQGDMHKPGELWGLWNLLRFSGQTVETRDILQAYKGRHRQQIEQQIQDDACRQQQQQGADGQPAATAAGAAGTSAAAAVGSAAKPFKIVVLDQLVGSADEDAGLESVLLGDVDTRSRRRHSRHSSAGRKRRSSEDSAAVDDPEDVAGDAENGAAVAVGSDVGGIVDADEAWCDESLIEGLMVDLLPQYTAGQRQQQQQHASKRKRRRTILSDSDEEQQDGEADEKGGKPQHGAGRRSAQQITNPAQLSPVAEGTAEGGGYSESEGSMGEGNSEGPGISTGSVGGSACSADGILQPVAAVDPLLAALEQQGAILHVHRHEKVLGKVKKSKADRQDPQQPHSRHHTPRKKPSQQQHEAQPARIAPLSSISSLVRGGVAAAYRQCTQAEATAADAAAGQGWVPVASLALWQGVGAAEMAQWLLKLTPEQRQQVLAMYASDMQ